ncbi:hypothetical protein FA13DRAFT_813923 [Coprinellus micaceus]|uniref:Uncharacterized protein n=1 Tax=Coprinellus micaceus TaxID=71717 RepID=A0A4Y7S4T6_COPMI|nr:hypothetical protein FA13DRAFT_813923 [Coprinellus micaceus]
MGMEDNLIDSNCRPFRRFTPSLYKPLSAFFSTHRCWPAFISATTTLAFLYLSSWHDSNSSSSSLSLGTSSPAMPSLSANNVAEVTQLGRDVPEILEARAPPRAAAKRPAVGKAAAKPAPRKKVVAKKAAAKQTRVPKKAAAPKEGCACEQEDAKENCNEKNWEGRKGRRTRFLRAPGQERKGW